GYVDFAIGGERQVRERRLLFESATHRDSDTGRSSQLRGTQWVAATPRRPRARSFGRARRDGICEDSAIAVILAPAGLVPQETTSWHCKKPAAGGSDGIAV
ncbi:MAG: hypothetical protein DWQ29_02920, partial [Planctomycetota bacterium]